MACAGGLTVVLVASTVAESRVVEIEQYGVNLVAPEHTLYVICRGYAGPQVLG